MKPEVTLAAFMSASTRLLCATLILAIAPHSFGKQLNPNKIVVFGASQESKCSTTSGVDNPPYPSGINDCYMAIDLDQPFQYPLWPNHLAQLMGAELANYARAGAYSETALDLAEPQVTGLVEQVQQYLLDLSESGDNIADAVHLISGSVNDPTVNAMAGTIDMEAKDHYIENMKSIVKALEEAGARHIFYLDYTASGRISGFYYIAYMPIEVREEPLNQFLLTIPMDCQEKDGEERLDCSDDLLTPLYKWMSDETWNEISKESSVVKRAPVGGFIREIEENMAFYGFQPDLYGFCYRVYPFGLPCLKEDIYGFSESDWVQGEEWGPADGDPTQFVFEDNVHWGPRTYRIFAVIMQDLIRNSLNAKYYKKGKGKGQGESAPFNFKRAYVKGRF